MEVQQLSKLAESDAVDDRNYERVCLYLLRCADFVSDPDDLVTLYHTAYEIYKKQGVRLAFRLVTQCFIYVPSISICLQKYCDALRVALRSNDDDKVTELFSEELGVSRTIQTQMCYMLGRHRSK